ncbi:MAG TPA: DUF2249 domain-containing protein [Opitutaceae bacterium]|nr:DUF2249 domain-containing protein [Opitutaceae bacterium]
MSAAKPRTSRTLDVRTMIAHGEEPFARIMQAVAALGAAEDLVLITPFLPAPLIEKLHSEGFRARPERRADGSWQTHFGRS